MEKPVLFSGIVLSVQNSRSIFQTNKPILMLSKKNYSPVIILAVLLSMVTQNTLANTPLKNAVLPTNHKNEFNAINPFNILNAHYEAIGGLERIKNTKNTHIKGRIRFAEIDGRFQFWSEGMQYRREEYYPGFAKLEGDNGQQMWSVDLNNKLLVHKDPDTLKRRTLRRLLQHQENLNPESKYFKIKYIGIENLNGEQCYVIETKNTINNDVYYEYYGIESFYLLKQIIKQPYLEISTTFSDFKRINDVIYAFHNEITIAPTGKKISMHLDNVKTNLVINSDKFIIPEDAAEDFRFDNRLSADSIPFLFVENNIYLPVSIGGEKHYWIVDSGADMSVIDADYARQLGLKSQGRLLGNTTNNLVEFNFVNLKKYKIHGLKLYNQNILSYKGLASNFFEPNAVGILGYDFLSRFITKVNYSKQTISFYHPESFTYNGIGRRIDAPLQNKLFMVPMTINDKFNGRFGLDLGSFNVSMNYPFAKKNNLLNKKGIKRLSSDIANVFKELQIKSQSLSIADYKVANEIISFPLEKGLGTNSDGEMDGLIGNSLLRHFILYLDYKNQQLIFEKGDDFNREFPVDKSGMIVGLSLNKMPEIVYVEENTPAQTAGILTEDIILAINNLEGENLPGIVEITKMFQAKAGTEYHLKLLRNKQIINVNMKLQDLY